MTRALTPPSCRHSRGRRSRLRLYHGCALAAAGCAANDMRLLKRIPRARARPGRCFVWATIRPIEFFNAFLHLPKFVRVGSDGLG